MPTFPIDHKPVGTYSDKWEDKVVPVTLIVLKNDDCFSFPAEGRLHCVCLSFIIIQ